jgi:hypothetical protein
MTSLNHQLPALPEPINCFSKKLIILDFMTSQECNHVFIAKQRKATQRLSNWSSRENQFGIKTSGRTCILALACFDQLVVSSN